MTEKDKDYMKIMDYISSLEGAIVKVAEVEQHSGAQQLRVFPILYDLYIKGSLEAVQHSFWGVPTVYRVM